MFAIAILSFCVCGISLRQILFAIVFIFDIVIIGFIAFIINIVQNQKKEIAGKNFRVKLFAPIINDGTGVPFQLVNLGRLELFPACKPFAATVWGRCRLKKNRRCFVTGGGGS